MQQDFKASRVARLDSPVCLGHGREGEHLSLGSLGHAGERPSLGVRPEAGTPLWVLDLR